MGRKKSWQVETPSRVGKSRCYSCFLMFLSCIGEWLHDARCFHPVLASNREIAHVCAGYASSFPAWKRTYHDLPWLTDSGLFLVVRGQKARTNMSKLWDPHPQCHCEEMVSMLVWIARALKPIAARGLTHWRLSRFHRWVFGAPNDKRKRQCQMQTGSDIEAHPSLPVAAKWS